MPELQITSGSEWRKENSEGILLQLPSGKVARIRSIDVSLMLKLGRIPDQLTQQIVDAVFGDERGKPMDFDIKTPERMKMFLSLMDGIVETCFILPRIVKVVTTEDEITVDDVEIQDKMFLFQLLNRPASALATFPEKQVDDVASVDSQPGHEAEAE